MEIRERTFAFAIRIVKLTQRLEKQGTVQTTVVRQLIRSGTSIGANVEEANGSQSKADFTAKMYIACKEARETLYWLRLLSATELIDPTKLAEIIDESDQIVAILTTIVKKSKANK